VVELAFQRGRGADERIACWKLRNHDEERRAFVLVVGVVDTVDRPIEIERRDVCQVSPAGRGARREPRGRSFCQRGRANQHNFVDEGHDGNQRPPSIAVKSLSKCDQL
jgi:hypothetical protein